MMERIIQVFPNHGTLAIKQDAVGGAHNRHLRQVVGIVIG